MPTYEYQCPEGHQFERFHKMNERPRVKCPTCGRAATRRISGGAGLVFKGSGFYITDYGKDGKGARKAEGDTAPAKPDAAPAAESKPAEPKAAAPKADKPVASGKKKAAE